MTAQATVPQQFRSARSWVAIEGRPLGLLILGLFAAYLLVNAWVGPQQASSVPSFEAHEGGYVLTDQPPRPIHQSRVGGTSLGDLSPSPDGTVVVWVAEHGRLKWSTLTESDPRLAGLQARPDRTASPDPRDHLATAQLLAAPTILLALGLILFGAKPRIGTRWYWAMLLLSPLCLGAAVYAYRERLKPPTEARVQRRTGIEGFTHQIGIWLVVLAFFGLLRGL